MDIQIKVQSIFMNIDKSSCIVLIAGNEKLIDFYCKRGFVKMCESESVRLTDEILLMVRLIPMQQKTLAYYSSFAQQANQDNQTD